MKYKDFKQMSANDMKNVIGGFAEPNGGCKAACYKWNNSTGSMENGTCSAGTVTVNGTTLSTCDCSLSGGTSCYGT